jgi:hypothetical protein
VLLPLFALALLTQNSPKTIELYRGAEIPGVAPRYWETEDTTLDSTGADINQGWQSELYGGEGKTMLIQFLGLNRAVGPNKRIVKASLVFSIASGTKISLMRIGRVAQGWNQGPVRNILEMNPDNAPTVGADGSATWRHRRLGGATWVHAGATGDSDTLTISEATSSEPDQDHFEVDNLGPSLEKMLESPLDNHGFMLQFKMPVSFYSAEASHARPRLILQVEDAPSAGAELEVTYIERTQKYDRYQSEGSFKTETQDGAAVPVMDHALNDVSKKWPSNGEEMTYIAHVKNVGGTVSEGFTGQAYADEKPLGTPQQGQVLQPGQEASFSFRAPYKSSPVDHRLSPLTFAVTANDGRRSGLEIQQDALSLGVFVEKGFYDKAPGFERWLQSQISLLNNVYFPYSRFSFAKDGVVERLRIDHLEVVPNDTLKTGSLPLALHDLSYDAAITFSGADAADLADVGKACDKPLLRRILRSLGVTDFSPETFATDDTRLRVVAKEGVISRGLEDLYPGLTGSGDTRDDSPLPSTYSLPYQPMSDEGLAQVNLEPTDLLSATDVSAFNTDIGKRRGFSGDYLYDTPVASLLYVYDYNGYPVPKAKLTFYQMVNSIFPADSRSFTLNTGDDGYATLFKRDPLTGGDDDIATGHVLRSNPFGRIDYRGLNSAFMVRATTAAGSEWAPLKLWQLVDADHRGQKVGLLRLYFNLPSDPLDPSTDVAQGKVISASEGDPSALGHLLDGSGATEISLPKANGSWIEIDLGRDRTIGEVQLVSKHGKFWKTFGLKTYETAQKPSDALAWSQELNWGWSFRNRPDDAGNGNISVAYRGTARRFRYLRIVNTGAATEAELSAIRLIPIKQGNP